MCVYVCVCVCTRALAKPAYFLECLFEDILAGCSCTSGTSDRLTLDLGGEPGAAATSLKAPKAAIPASSAAKAATPTAGASGPGSGAGAVAGRAGGTALHLGGPEGRSIVAQLADAAELVMGVGGVVYVQVGG